jgi:hypothetical protein
VDEAVALRLVVGVAALDGAAEAAHGVHDFLFDFALGRPALLVGGETEVSAGDQND